MKSSCESDSCCSSSADCGDSCADSCHGPGQCGGEAGCDCPVESMTRLWTGSFGAAMKQAQTEILKAKILKAWGPMMEQAADNLLETMGAVWAAKIAEVKVAEAKQTFQQRLRDLMFQEKKK